MVIDPALWRGRKVLVTGHTGFKGGWLCLWLQRLGAKVTGYALEAPTKPNLFDVARVAEGMQSITADIRDLDHLSNAVSQAAPEMVIHMAAQSLVRASYDDPLRTYSTNLMGTVNVFEAVRNAKSVRVVLNVTSDKCYNNREWIWGYREDEPMGGADPYSSSKGCSELITSAYRRSFFGHSSAPVALASARAGNVIGGGDWAPDRLVPDFFRAIEAGRELVIRNPDAVRPWQYVLEPLYGYLLLAQALWSRPGDFADAWNFGPSTEDEWPVRRVAEQLSQRWGTEARWTVDKSVHPYEAHYLKLDCSKARAHLGWKPSVALENALERIVAWFRGYMGGVDMRQLTIEQIASYEGQLTI